MFRGAENRADNMGALSAELERQADVYRGLGVRKDAIMRLLTPRPDRLPKELSIPVVTLGASVDLDHQARFAGITPYFDLSRAYDTAGGITYAQPRLIWMQDGEKNKGRSVEYVRAHLKGNERPATLADGIALAITQPDIKSILRNHAIDLPGSAVGSAYAPDLGVFHGGLGLNLDFVDDGHPGWGSASSGS
jgi:hypothetical protein